MVSVLVALVLALAAAILFAAHSWTTVFEYERALRFVKGRLKGELGPGLYRYLRASTRIVKIDTRPTQLTVGGQEILSRDGVAVKVSLSATYRVNDIRTAVLQVDNYAAALYLELQQAARTAVSAVDVETLIQSRADLAPQLLASCRPAAERLGLAIEGIAVRDLTLPGEMKKIFAQVVKARQEGLAALERARGESAALRNLANAAQMVQRHPQLLQLRLLQVAGQQPGATWVVGMPQGTGPIPLRDAAAGQEKLVSEGDQTDEA